MFGKKTPSSLPCPRVVQPRETVFRSHPPPPAVLCPPRARPRPWLWVVHRELFIDNLLVRIHLFIAMIRWTGLAAWEFEFPFLGSLTCTFLGVLQVGDTILLSE